MNIITKDLGNKWLEYTLTNDNGMSMNLLNYGGIITKLLVPNRVGKFENVVLGFQNYEDYEQNSNYFGGIIGRVAGRIEGASFQLEGKNYELRANEGDHHLHGGSTAFHKVLWKGQPFQDEDTVGVKLMHTSPAGEGGYPGNVNITVTYTLSNNDELIIDYHATTDSKTALTLTNHTYFNLTGNLVDTIANHNVTMNCNLFLELDSDLIPTGQLVDVSGSPFDFRSGRKLLEGFHTSSYHSRIAGEGYDHYFLFEQNERPYISVQDPSSGRLLEITTNQPGVVMYTANGLEEGLNLTGGRSKKHLGVCFETQASPASLKFQELPSIVLDVNDVYKKQTIFKFGCKQ